MLKTEIGRRGGIRRKRQRRWSVAEFAAAVAGILLLVLAVSLNAQRVQAVRGQRCGITAKVSGQWPMKAGR